MRWLLIGIVWLYFLVLLVGPILYMASQSFSEGLAAFWAEISRPEALHGFTLTAEITLIVLVLNLIFGTMTALVLARQQFWGRSLVSGVIDLPFAVSPVIAGFMLILLFGPDTLLGAFFGQAQIKVLFALPAMILATPVRDISLHGA
jgi:sulfate transport system permease protein